jgi:hypothetical protein
MRAGVQQVERGEELKDSGGLTYGTSVPRRAHIEGDSIPKSTECLTRRRFCWDSAASEDDHSVRKETRLSKERWGISLTAPDYTSQSPGGLDVALSDESGRCLVQCPHHPQTR